MKIMKTLGLAAASIALPLAAYAGCDHGGACDGHAGAGKILLLGTLALGYWVLRTARKDKDTGWFKWVSHGTGWIILLASLAALACTLCKTCHAKKGSAASCPFHQNAEQPPTE
ncbi:MAG: hypothetical protein HYT79_04040 [Elusimicrobia bacterium]|nr:hypothetical protein [Elusimicrobiota bacterium]